MMKFFKLVLPMLLVTSLALGGARDKRKQLELMDQQATGPNPVLAGVTAGWTSVDLELATSSFKSIEYLPTGVIWIAGGNSPFTNNIAWRSTDHGSSWTKSIINRTASSSGSTGISDITARDANIAVTGTFTGEILRTANGGAKWDTVFSYGAGAGFFDGVRFVGKDTVIAIGDADADGVVIVRSTNAGATWTRIPKASLPNTDSVTVADSWISYASFGQAMCVYQNTVWTTWYWGANVRPLILKSTDAGVTWSVIRVNLPDLANNYYFRSIDFKDANIGYGVNRRRGGTTTDFDQWFIRTTDGGVTWSDTISVQPGVAHAQQKVYTAKAIPGTNNVVAVGFSTTTGSKSWWSTDAGLTWTVIPTPGTTNLTNSAWLSPTQGVAVGFRQVLRYSTKNTRQVTFICNTATVPDTLPVVGANIQMRGGVNHAGGVSPITWGNDSQNNMTNIGGDYWSKTLSLQVGDTIRYKFVVGYAAGAGTGWEQNTTPADPPLTGGDRSYIVADKDSTLKVQYWNNGANGAPQYFTPWTAVSDTFINVWFRVNMQGIISAGSFGYNNDRDTIAVRGGGPAGGDLNWSPSFYLTRESPATNGDGYTIPANTFWSGRVRIPKSADTVGQVVQYKYLIGYDWGRDELQGQSNRSFKIPVGKKDTTIKYVYYNNQKPTQRANPDTCRIVFNVNLANAIQTGGFTQGDTIYVRSGYFGTAVESGRRKQLTRLSGTLYTVTDTIITGVGKLLDYQYYAFKNGQEVRENYYNFLYDLTKPGAIASEAERRQINVPSKSFAVYDTATSIQRSNRQPVFPNQRKLLRNVRVRYECDVRPAYYKVLLTNDTLKDIQGTFNIYKAVKDSIFKWGVWMNGPAVGGWSNATTDWGLGLVANLNKKLYDDGTNGDRVANDSIYSRFVFCSPDSFGVSTAGSKGQVGQVFKFGIRGGDNEGGSGGYGNNHAQNIVDTDTAYTIAEQFGSINPSYYNAWDYDLRKPKTPTGVVELPGTVPVVFDLTQNYPNPFNPTTKIEYSIPNQSFVTLKVYNVIGQEVATLVDEFQKAGRYKADLDASKLATGVYLYRLTAGDFVSTKKMLLLK